MKHQQDDDEVTPSQYFGPERVPGPPGKEQLVEFLDNPRRSLGPFAATDGELVIQPGQAVESIPTPANPPGSAGVSKKLIGGCRECQQVSQAPNSRTGITGR